MDRRQFLSRFFKGLAIAAIAPEVIAKACEEHSIAKGTFYSLGRRHSGTQRIFTIPPHYQVQFSEHWHHLVADQEAQAWLDECNGKIQDHLYNEVKALQAGRIQNFMGADFLRTDLTVRDTFDWNTLARYFMPKEADLSL